MVMTCVGYRLRVAVTVTVPLSTAVPMPVTVTVAPLSVVVMLASLLVRLMAQLLVSSELPSSTCIVLLKVCPLSTRPVLSAVKFATSRVRLLLTDGVPGAPSSRTGADQPPTSAPAASLVALLMYSGLPSTAGGSADQPAGTPDPVGVAGALAERLNT